MYYEIFSLQADLLKALAYPKRLEIIHLLRNKEISVSGIQEMLDLPQANLSQHLTHLRNAGVVDTRRDGKQIYYKLTDNNFIKTSDLMRQILVKRYKNNPIADELTLKMSELVPLASDPICSMRLSPKTASYALKHKGEFYYFCASGCLETFKKHPDKFISN